MPTIATLTHDQDPPHRPGLSELGGGGKLDHPDPNFRPDPDTMITAADFNQFSRQLEADGRVLPLARLLVTFDGGGVPSIQRVQALGNNVVSGSFSVTDTATGDTLIAWRTGAAAPAGALAPAIGVKAWPTRFSDDVKKLVAELTTDGSGNPAARVRCVNSSNAAIDAPFGLEIF